MKIFPSRTNTRVCPVVFSPGGLVSVIETYITERCRKKFKENYEEKRTIFVFPVFFYFNI